MKRFFVKLFLMGIFLVPFKAMTYTNPSGFNPNAIVTIQGKVLQVVNVPNVYGKSGGIHLLLDTNQERIIVHLCPEWFAENIKLHLVPGDYIEVKGSLVESNGEKALVAIKVRSDDKSYTFRDNRGVPAWAGRGKRHMGLLRSSFHRIEEKI